MKKFYFLVCFSVAMFFLTSTDAIAQNLDTSKVKPVYKNAQLNDNYHDLQLYFLNQEKNFDKQEARQYLYSISYDTVNLPDPAPRYFRLGYDYLWGLNVHNISIGVNPLKYRENGYNIFLSGRVGFGAGESKLILKDETKGAKINSMFGVEAEVESPGYFRFARNLKFFGGIGFSYIKPENFVLKDKDQNDSINEVNGGTAIDPFLGVRYYLAPKNSHVKFALQAKVGFIYSNGIKHLNDNAPSLYYGIGANIISSQSFTKKGDVGLMKFESGIFISPVSGVLYGQFTQPVILLQNLSVGLNGHIGSGLYESAYNKKRVNTYWGVGVDLRFFGYDEGQVFKPYIGVMFQNYGYQFQDTLSQGFKYKAKVLTFLRIGSKIQLGRKSNWCFDINAGVPLASADTFLLYQGVVLKSPVLFEVNLGLVYKIKFFEERNSKNYLGKVEIYKQEDIAKLDEPQFDPLPQDLFADTLIETKVYIQGEPLTRAGLPNIDVSDIKILRFLYDSKSAIDNVSPNFFYKVKDKSQDSLMLLIAMFDKERCDVKEIGKNNMYLVFNDLNKSRYFGFTYDINKRLQPEMGSKESLVVDGDTPYYGSYQEFIKKLHWLDEDVLPLSINSLDGKEIERDILRYFDLFNEELKAECISRNIKPYTVSKGNFRFAYAIYPQETFAKIKESCENFGVSIMFRYDLNNTDKEDADVFGFTESVDGALIIDPKDAAFFSNLIHGSDIYSSPCEGDDLLIDEFVLGKDYLTDAHKARLSEIKSFDCSISDISGYTDKVEFTRNAEFMNDLFSMRNNAVVRNCTSLNDELDILLGEWQAMLDKDSNALPPDELCQRGLAWKRIRSTLEELDAFGFVIRSIKTHPVGIDSYTKNGDSRPQSRKVVITFSK